MWQPVMAVIDGLEEVVAGAAVVEAAVGAGVEEMRVEEEYDVQRTLDPS